MQTFSPFTAAEPPIDTVVRACLRLGRDEETRRAFENAIELSRGNEELRHMQDTAFTHLRR